jgi:lipopolysaccharide assembly protein B
LMEGFIAWLPWIFVAAIALFALGWLGARFESRRIVSESRALPQAYFQGLNHLLNDESDQAIAALLEAAKQHPDAIELQFALGSLFRRRGEIDRALHVHKALSERGGLTPAQRVAARYETALDYHKSGLLDHAEEILCGLADKHEGSDAQQMQVLRLLLNLYEQERAWKSAIDTALRLDSDLPPEKRQYTTRIANFYCERAHDAHNAGDVATAIALLDRALNDHPGCVRANLLRGEWQAKAGQHREAIATWHLLEAQDPAYLGLAADKLLASYQALGEMDAGLADLQSLHQRYPALDMFNALFKATLAKEGAAAALALVKADLRDNATLVGLDRMLEAEVLLAGADTPHAETLAIEKAIVHSHASRLAVYLCKSCGFKAKQWYWHCPACVGWDTFPPRRTAEYDTAERHLSQIQVERIHNA